MTADHIAIEQTWPRTETNPAEVYVYCIGPDCDWTFESQESIGGGVETWGDAWDEHIEEIEREEEV